jgi:hypothetical protein
LFCWRFFTHNNPLGPLGFLTKIFWWKNGVLTQNTYLHMYLLLAFAKLVFKKKAIFSSKMS